MIDDLLFKIHTEHLPSYFFPITPNDTMWLPFVKKSTTVSVISDYMSG